MPKTIIAGEIGKLGKILTKTILRPPTPPVTKSYGTRKTLYESAVRKQPRVMYKNSLTYLLF